MTNTCIGCGTPIKPGKTELYCAMCKPNARAPGDALDRQAIRRGQLWIDGHHPEATAEDLEWLRQVTVGLSEAGSAQGTISDRDSQLS